LRIALRRNSRSVLTGLPSLELLLDEYEGLFERLVRKSSEGIYQPIIYKHKF